MRQFEIMFILAEEKRSDHKTIGTQLRYCLFCCYLLLLVIASVSAEIILFIQVLGEWVCVWLAVGMRLSQVLYPLHDGKLFVQLLSEVCRELLLLFDYDYLLNRSFDLLIIRSVVAKCNIPAQSNKTKQMSYSCCCSRHRNRQQLQDDNR